MTAVQKLTGLALAVSVAGHCGAQSSREQLELLVQELRTKPADHALRERIVKLGAEIKPPPAVPEEANRREGRGKFAFRSAKSNEDYLAAAAEFEEAAKAAPWVAGYYSDLCTIYEKAEKYVEAKRNCQLFLIGSSDPALIGEIKQRIAGLEYGIEKASSPEALEKAKAASNEALVRGLDGARFDCPTVTNSHGTTWRKWFVIAGARLTQHVEVSNPKLQIDPRLSGGTETWPIKGAEVRLSGPRGSDTFEIRADRLLVAGTWDGKPLELVSCARSRN